MIPSPLRQYFAAASLLVAAAACGGSDGPTAVAPSTPGITAVAGGSVTDTILSAPLQALVVEVRTTGGALAKGTVVKFTAQVAADSTRRAYETPLYVCALSATTCGPAATNTGFYGPYTTASADTTDANGRAKATIRLGTVAGPTYVVVTVPEFGLKDSVPYTVTAGAARYVRLTTHDTALTPGAKATFKGAVVDSYYNPRSDAVAYSLGNAPGVATLDAATAAVTAVDVGTTWLYARAGSGVDSASVRVVPTGRLLVWDAGMRSVRLVGTDGGAVRTLETNVSSDYGAFPHYSPSGTVVAFHAGDLSYGGVPSRVVVMDSTGANRREIGLPSGVAAMTHPRPLADGRVLFVGRQPLSSGYVAPTSVYAIAADGGVSVVAPLPNASMLYGGFDISPDGSRVAYVSTDPNGYGQPSGLNVLTLATGQTTLVDANGVSPSWAPAGDRLAFLVPGPYGSDGTLATVNADGTGRTSLPVADTFSPGLAWSPNSAYVLGRTTSSGLRAVRVRDGASVLLRLPAAGGPSSGYPADYYQPDWR